MDTIRDEVNQGEVTFYFENPSLTSVTSVTNDGMGIYTNMGGRASLDSFNDRQDMGAGSGNFRMSTSGINVACRVYSQPKDLDKVLAGIGIQAGKNVIKINLDEEYRHYVRNASYVEHNQTKYKALRLEAPYGLFGKVYFISYLQEL